MQAKRVKASAAQNSQLLEQFRGKFENETVDEDGNITYGYQSAEMDDLMGAVNALYHAFASPYLPVFNHIFCFMR